MKYLVQNIQTKYFIGNYSLNVLGVRAARRWDTLSHAIDFVVFYNLSDNYQVVNADTLRVEFRSHLC